MRGVSPQHNSNIHVLANMALLLVIEAAVGYGLWQVLSPWWLWAVTFFCVFWALAYMGHRLLPTVTGPVVDRLFPIGEQSGLGSAAGH